tara:strand:+ start:1950 stop:2819 length:870 start_codon:yes stop_codon:yes gene_type:complete
MKTLICIYTCEKNKNSLFKFKQTRFYNEIKKSDKFKIIEVYADGKKTHYDNNKLILDCEENYSQLSIKSFKMIFECVEKFSFDKLIKIDCNIFEYKTNEYGFPYEILNNLLCETEIKNLVFSENKNDYFGSMLSFSQSENSLKKWANVKNLKVSCLKWQHRVLFFTGKCYCLSRNFCEYIKNNGKQDSEYFAKNYGGVEDLYVGYMYSKYKSINSKFDLILNYVKHHTESNNLQTQKYFKRLMDICDIQFKKFEFEEKNCVNSDKFIEFDFKKMRNKYDKKRNEIFIRI